MRDAFTTRGAIAYALIYFTFFLDNVLLTVLVPIVPELLGEEDWSPASLNSTSAADDSSEWRVVAVSGAVLGAKAGAQLAAARGAARAVHTGGALRVLRGASALLLVAAAVICVTSTSWWRTGAGLGATAWCVGAGRAVQGAGAAGAGVAGLSLASSLAPPRRRRRAIAVLLGATALGVLVGYPLGGAAYQLWSRAAPFQILTVAAATNLVIQCTLLDKEDFDQGSVSSDCIPEERGRVLNEVRGGCGEAARWTAGAVLLTTSVMAALEPCLPIWITHKFHPQRWTRGMVFVPDSLGYLLATAAGSFAGPTEGEGSWEGAVRVAVTGQVAVGFAALALPYVTAVSWLALPHFALGLGLGALDAALVPALLARSPPPRVPPRAALLQRASSAAYTLGPVVGGVMTWSVGFDSLVRALGVINLLYAAALYAHQFSNQWDPTDSEDGDDGGSEQLHLAPLTAQRHYTTLRDET